MHMPDIPVDFEAPDLAARVERLSPSQIDQLPFGAILLDGEGIVLFYSAAERRLSGYPGVAVGKNFFEIARCLRAPGDCDHLFQLIATRRSD